MPRAQREHPRSMDTRMTYADERVAAEMGRVLLALYRAGMQVRVWPDPAQGPSGGPDRGRSHGQAAVGAAPLGERRGRLSARRHLRGGGAAQRALGRHRGEPGLDGGALQANSPSSFLSMSSSTFRRMEPGISIGNLRSTVTSPSSTE